MNLKLIYITSLLTLYSCISNNNPQAKIDNRLLDNLEHHIKDNSTINKHDSSILYTGWYYTVDNDNGFKRQLDKSTSTYFIDPKPIVVVKNFTTIEIYESNNGTQKHAGLSIWLDEKGAKNWSIATEKAIGKQLALIIDNRLIQVAKVNSQITSGITALNRAEYSRVELENFKTIIESEK